MCACGHSFLFFPLLAQIVATHLREGEQNHQRQHDRTNRDLGKRDIGRLKNEKHQGAKNSVKAQGHDLRLRIAAQDDTGRGGGHEQQAHPLQDGHDFCSTGSSLERIGTSSPGTGRQCSVSAIRKARAAAWVTTVFMPIKTNVVTKALNDSGLRPSWRKMAIVINSGLKAAGAEM